MKNPIKTLEPNTLGKDYVVGDLHGCFSVFEKMLKNINFNPEVDRMISVGDLIDRGPDNVGCLRLLREPWFHAVHANHEQMMVNAFEHSNSYLWVHNGGAWGYDALAEYTAVFKNQSGSMILSDLNAEIIDLYALIENNPLLITVKTKSGGKVHAIHAELPLRSYVVTDDDLADPDKLMKLASVRTVDGDTILWGRRVFGGLSYDPPLSKEKIVEKVENFRLTDTVTDALSPIISGHTILCNPITVLNMTNIDTGAYKMYPVPATPYGQGTILPEPWAGLTCLDIDEWRFYKTTENAFEEVTPTVVTREDLI